MTRMKISIHAAADQNQSSPFFQVAIFPLKKLVLLKHKFVSMVADFLLAIDIFKGLLKIATKKVTRQTQQMRLPDTYDCKKE